MKSSRLYVVAMVIAMLAGAALPAAEAVGQSERELRREVERLRERNRELERELEAARRQIKSLESAIERLNNRLSELRDQRPDSADDESEEVTIDESVPHASPRALFRAVVESYEEAVGDTEIGEDGDRQRSLYIRAVERWRARANREYRSTIDWHVRVLESEETRGGYRLTVAAVDPTTDVQLGDSFTIDLPRRQARRYEQLVERGQAEKLRVRGVLVPEIQVNADRRDPGPFNVPPLIGPFAEFGFRIDPNAMTAPGDEDGQR